MNRPAAVMDKSVLHSICEKPRKQLDFYFSNLLRRHQLMVPPILEEEVLVNLASPKGKSLETVQDMVECLKNLQDHWTPDPLEIAFYELVKREPIEVSPGPSEELANSLSTQTGRERAVKFAKGRLERRKLEVSSVVAEMSSILPQNKFVLVDDEKDFFK